MQPCSPSMNPTLRLPPRVLRPRLHSEALPASVTFAYHSASLPLRASAFWAGLSSASSLDRSSSSICGVSHPYHSPNPNSRNRPQPARPIYPSIKLYIHTYLVTPTGHISPPASTYRKPQQCAKALPAEAKGLLKLANEGHRKTLTPSHRLGFQVLGGTGVKSPFGPHMTEHTEPSTARP